MLKVPLAAGHNPQPADTNHVEGEGQLQVQPPTVSAADTWAPPHKRLRRLASVACSQPTPPEASGKHRSTLPPSTQSDQPVDELRGLLQVALTYESLGVGHDDALGAQQTTIDDLRAQLAERKSQISSLRIQQRNAKQQIANLRGQVKKLERQSTHGQATIADLRQRLDAVEARASASEQRHQSTHAELQKTVQSQRQKIERQAGEIRAKEDEVDLLRFSGQAVQDLGSQISGAVERFIVATGTASALSAEACISAIRSNPGTNLANSLLANSLHRDFDARAKMRLGVLSYEGARFGLCVAYLEQIGTESRNDEWCEVSARAHLRLKNFDAARSAVEALEQLPLTEESKISQAARDKLRSRLDAAIA